MENTGRWANEEHDRFLKAIEKYGSNWKMVEKEVRSRTATQCRSHAQKHFQKIEKNESPHMDFTARPAAETAEIAIQYGEGIRFE